MVYYFTSTAPVTTDDDGKKLGSPAMIYVGKDKFENEELISFGWEEDVCAHIYLRMEEGQKWDQIDKTDAGKQLLVDLGQLTKANSIEGNKKDNITIIYTPWSNLKKDGSMAVGQVGFHDRMKVKKVFVEKRENPVVNRLNKTKVEKHPDLKQEKEDRQRELRKRQQAAQQERRKEEQRLAQERKEKKRQKDHAYDDLFTDENMMATSNQDRDESWEDDFM